MSSKAANSAYAGCVHCITLGQVLNNTTRCEGDILELCNVAVATRLPQRNPKPQKLGQNMASSFVTQAKDIPPFVRTLCNWILEFYSLFKLIYFKTQHNAICSNMDGHRDCHTD